MFGIALGFGILVMAIGLGLAGLLRAVPQIHTALQYAGAAYLIYLAWCIARAEGKSGGDANGRLLSDRMGDGNAKRSGNFGSRFERLWPSDVRRVRGVGTSNGR